MATDGTTPGPRHERARHAAPSAKERAYRHVKRRILDGALPGGELLSEGEVAEELGMSRTPVREAFLLLEAEGLMHLYPKRGALVVPVSPEEVRDVMEARQVVERHAATVVATRPPAGILEELEALIAEQDERRRADDPPGFVDADRRFHRALVVAAGNAVLLRFYDSLRDRQRRMGTATIMRDPGAMAAFVDEHRAIVRALAAGGRDEAADRLGRHIAGARARLQA